MAVRNRRSNFDVLRDRGLGLGPRRQRETVEKLDLARPEETLRACVVPAVPPPTRAARHARLLEGSAVGMAGVLAATIRVVEQIPHARPLRPCSPQGFERELLRDAIAHRKAHHATREQVQDHRQVEPSWVARDGSSPGDLTEGSLLGPHDDRACRHRSETALESFIRGLRQGPARAPRVRGADGGPGTCGERDRGAGALPRDRDHAAARDARDRLPERALRRERDRRLPEPVREPRPRALSAPARS